MVYEKGRFLTPLCIQEKKTEKKFIKFLQGAFRLTCNDSE